ncbi:MAG: uL15m family ribosomal protein [bacterium]
MKLHTLKKATDKKSKRLGLGYGSGRGGHTSSRGQKGQKSRGDMPLTFVGSSWVWFKRLPFMRGKSIFNSIKNSDTLTLSDLSHFENGAIVNHITLREKGFTKKGQGLIAYKIVNSGKLDKKLTVQVPATKTAQEAIIKAGGEYQGETA